MKITNINGHDGVHVNKGMIMLLILSNEYDPHADLIINELKIAGIQFWRLNSEDLFENASFSCNLLKSKVNIVLHGKDLTDILKDTKLILSRGFSMENVSPYEDGEISRLFCEEARAFIYGLLYSTSIPWFNNPLAVEFAAHKINQLKIAKGIGFNLPDTLVTNSSYDLLEFSKQHHRIIHKVLNLSRIDEKDDGACLSYASILNVSELNKERVSVLPSIYQEYVEKYLELRITIIGDTVICVEIDSQSYGDVIDWRKIPSHKIRHTKHELPDDIKNKCIKMVEMLNLSYGAIDMIIDKNNNYFFLEINPEGLWGWLELMADLQITKEIVKNINYKLNYTCEYT